MSTKAERAMSLLMCVIGSGFIHKRCAKELGYNWTKKDDELTERLVALARDFLAGKVTSEDVIAAVEGFFTSGSGSHTHPSYAHLVASHQNYN